MSAHDKPYIGGVDEEDQRCLRCGSKFLDTGWECNDCGYDNIEHYCPPEIRNKHPGATHD